MFQHWLFPQIQQDRGDFICTQEGAPLHFNHDVRQYLNDPNLTPCDFYLWGNVKDSLYVPPASLQDFRDRIVTAMRSVTRDQFLRLWQEMDYRFVA
ncbi:hypothetical protein AVEN_109010-1 [Araneus ventricosus]|uniref:Transposable element Tc3 transposase n=1 Tax=Araneus ventricosus TaxID=182803 RepID=A0A4Y1ZZC3_ARAVE|nr:hypothetical protein AVEN_109010-1 [Araneus ventricosus]